MRQIVFRDIFHCSKSWPQSHNEFLWFKENQICVTLIQLSNHFLKIILFVHGLVESLFHLCYGGPIMDAEIIQDDQSRPTSKSSSVREGDRVHNKLSCPSSVLSCWPISSTCHQNQYQNMFLWSFRLKTKVILNKTRHYRNNGDLLINFYTITLYRINTLFQNSIICADWLILNH